MTSQDTSEKRPIVVITGPTASGKTAVSVEIAKRFDGEVVNADSMQIYRGLNIGVGKISESEMCGIRHHLFDICDADEDFNVSKYRKIARKTIDEIHGRGKLPIIAGGTFQYIEAILYGKDVEEPGVDREYKKSLAERERNGGLAELYDELETVDGAYASSISRNDGVRIKRALEYCRTTGLRYSDFCKEIMDPEPRYDCLYFILSCERTELCRRIDLRIDGMMQKGLVDEVRGLMSSGADLSNTSMYGIGYKEIAGYLNGKRPLDDAVSSMRTHTKRYAARQMTRFRKVDGAIWIESDDAAADNIGDIIGKRFHF